MLTIALAALCGCTSIRYGDVRYISIMQRKSLEVTSGTLTIRYNTQSDADSLAPLVQAAVKGAVEGAR